MTLPTRLAGGNGCTGGLLSPNVGMIALRDGPARSRLRGWWKVDDLDGFADGAAVDTWPDATGNGFDFMTDTDSTTDPVIDAGVTLNGYRGLKFSPSSTVRDSMSADGLNIFASCVRAASMFYLIRRHTPASSSPLAGGPVVGTLASGTPNGTHWPYTDGSTYDGNLRDTGSRVNSLALGAWTGTTYLVEVSTSVADGWDMRRNGSVVASVAQAWPGGDGISEFRIGGNVANAFYGHPAHYWEVLAYDGVPSAANRSAIHDYFNAKYGLSLPT